MRSWLCFLATVGFALGFGAPVYAQTPPHAQDAPPGAQVPGEPQTSAGKMLARVLRMFAGDVEAIGEDDLSESFRKAVPLKQLRQVAAQIRAGEGTLKLEAIDEGASERALVASVVGSKKGTPFKLRLNLDEQDRIVGLLVQPGIDKRVPELRSWDELEKQLAGAAEHVSAGVVERTEPEVPEGMEFRISKHVFGHAIHQPLAIGSAFKLWVLGALAEQVHSGKAGWDEKLKIREAIKSLPSGVMQDQKEGTEFTLREFAEKMISISDNTATDHLIHRVGRESCERFMASHVDAPERNAPFLTTRDLFVLKLTPGNDLPERYLKADVDGRRALLGPEGEVTSGTAQIILAALWKSPRYIDTLEWFASARDMAATMFRLDSMSRTKGLEPIRDILAINPGVPIDRKVWKYVGYKGGSEPGVLSLTWLLERRDGRRFVVSMTFNNTKKPIDEPLGIALASRAVEFLGKWDVKEPARAPVEPAKEPAKETGNEPAGRDGK